MEEALHDVPLLRKFEGLTRNTSAPDETTILRFRRLVEEHKLALQILALVNDLLQAVAFRNIFKFSFASATSTADCSRPQARSHDGIRAPPQSRSDFRYPGACSDCASLPFAQCGDRSAQATLLRGLQSSWLVWPPQP